MTKHNCTQEEGILLFESAGFTVKLGTVIKGTTDYWLYEGDEKIYYSSAGYDLESPERVMKQLQRIWKGRGIERGRVDMQDKFKKLLDYEHNSRF